MDLSQRHAGVQDLMRFFKADHLPAGAMQNVSGDCIGLAYSVVAQLPDSPELTAGLRKLLEAKDCFVRAALPKS